ncbi:MAG: TIGR04282 family arsenosugar biosynthesis glycosyltransferase [Gammaproteobacteria bacterium]
MYHYPEAAIVVFSKAPVPGQVKTRLCPPLNAQQAALLYEAMIQHTLTTVTSSYNSKRHAQEIRSNGLKHTHRTADRCLAPVQLWVDDIHHSYWQTLVADKRSATNQYVLLQQQGKDLGARLTHTAENVLKTYQYFLVIGCDAVTLTIDYVAQALSMLSNGTDIVLGPAEDGGYVLMGMRRMTSTAYKKLFDGVAWSTSNVLAQTSANAQKLRLEVRCLATLWDVDWPQDLIRLKNLARNNVNKQLQFYLLTELTD